MMLQLASYPLLIPPIFTTDGHLPLGRHPTDVEEIEARLVQPFAASSNRRQLYDAWRTRRTTLFDIVTVQMEWVDGSFVTTKHSPADIDLVTFIHAQDIEDLSIDDRRAVSDLTQGDGPRQVGCHSFLVVVFPENHHGYDSYLKSRGYWDVWWSRQRTGQEKGYLEVRGPA